MLHCSCGNPAPGSLPASSGIKAGSRGSVSQLKASFGPRLRRPLCAACSTARRGSSRFGSAGKGPPPAASREGKTKKNLYLPENHNSGSAPKLPTSCGSSYLQRGLISRPGSEPPLLRKENTRPFYCTELQKCKGSKCHRGGSALSRRSLITQKPLPHAFF